MNASSESSLTAPPQSRARPYRTDGFLILREVFERTEMAELDAEATRVFQRKDLIDLSPVFARVAQDESSLATMSLLSGEPAFPFKDKLIFKPPGALGYALHQDYISRKTLHASFVTVIPAIDPAEPRNGATEVFPGYHQRGERFALNVHDRQLLRQSASAGQFLFLSPEKGARV
jgi:ectoine hydroxylase-related dioxygenase (phytanoyl-CoA dioxygenase family)